MKGQRLLMLLLTTMLVATFASGQPPPGKKKIVFDQDTDGIIGGNNDPLVMLLQSPDIDVLGFTIATGNGWLKQETADVFKLLEVIGRPDVPVYMGSEFPLVQSKETPIPLTKLHGGSRTDPFLGHMASTAPDPMLLFPRPEAWRRRKRSPAMQPCSSSSLFGITPIKSHSSAVVRSPTLRLP